MGILGIQSRVPQQSTRPGSAAAEGPYHYYCDKNPEYSKCYLTVDRPLCCSYRTNVSRETNVSKRNRSKGYRNRNPEIGVRKKGVVQQGVRPDEPEIPTLIVVPPSIIGIWVQQTAKCLVGGDPLLGAWALRCGYTKGKIPRYVSHVEKEDRARLNMLSSGPNQFHEEASNTVVITTKKCYQVHVKYVFDEWVRQGRRHIKKCAIATFGWGRVCVDEAHEKVHADRERGINT